jgi:hypothetical protein
VPWSRVATPSLAPIPRCRSARRSSSTPLYPRPVRRVASTAFCRCASRSVCTCRRTTSKSEVRRPASSVLHHFTAVPANVRFRSRLVGYRPAGSGWSRSSPWGRTSICLLTGSMP